MAGSGVFFHKKNAKFTDGYKATGTVMLPTKSTFLPSGSPTFVAYAQFGCFGSRSGNFDAGIVIQGNGNYALFINGGAVIKPQQNGSRWYQTSSVSRTGSTTLTVELVWLASNRGKVVVTGLGISLEAEFGDGWWAGNFQNGVQFCKELTVACSADAFADMFKGTNHTKTKTVYMNDITFGQINVARHSGQTTVLDTTTNSTAEKTPYLDGDSKVWPTWENFRYGMSSTTAASNYFSIDCVLR